MIAYVDSDLSVREAILDFLEAHGFEAFAVETAEELIGSGRLSQVWCVISDIQLRGMSGLLLQSYLKSIGRDMPLIFMTSFPDARTRTKALEQGALCYLTKPVRKDVLLTCIEDARRKRGAS